jgi:hypothetical protein
MLYKKEIIISVVGILIVILTGWIVIKEQQNQFAKYELFCDEKYGVDNWYYMQTYNASISLLDMIYVCVENKSNYYVNVDW